MKKNLIVLNTLLYFNEAGISSYIEIEVIIPAINAINIPITKSFIYGAKNKYAIIAPISSDIPDTKVYPNALNLLLVL